MDYSPNRRTEVGGEVSLVPYYEDADEEVVGQDGHADYGVEDEAEEMGEGCEGDAVGGPRAVVIHSGDTSVQTSGGILQRWRLMRENIPPALPAMMSPGRLNGFAFSAPSLPLL